MKVDLSRYDNSWYYPGRGVFVRTLWYFVNALFFVPSIWPVSSLKVRLLRVFGAKIGKGVVIKPRVNIKYPWNLSIGDYTWIGEGVWIDNLARVSIGANCCLSQDALLLCGNHNYTKPTFDLMVGEITLEDGVWIGARSVVSGNTYCYSHSVLALQSVSGGKLDAYSVYRGNPAEKVKTRDLAGSID
ncbi:WcaF family extracellular polysaccharide biosynthesis acetyltransferase [Marinilabilia rubra]|uniref:Colanic acid biosynthesis acetyltransferase WcaF n=1 Tax=Marinilabilia rubra TaxID=2162893 RepID=A0A2U2BAX7_9BACT|nr:WcaF family extracellular polysaccharide biosynthesis acetyltransferase [Marinilabilia rubra]PWE00225.1 colanic acid biosynthesis acetyltransferase WcaF [Marinilabilia rubra]